MLDSYRLKVFCVVAEKGSFTEAARELGVSQPAVSQNIAELEKKLGCELLVRSRGEVRLNAAGKDLLCYAERILYWCERAEKHFTSPDECAEDSPATLRIDGETSAEIFAEDGTLRIRLLKDKNL